MHGMVDFIMGKTEEGQVNKKTEKNKDIKEVNNFFSKKMFFITIIAMATIIAIILVSLVIKSNKQKDFESRLYAYSIEDIKFSECKDDLINYFIKSYFRARLKLDYDNVFRAFGRDYYTEKINNKKVTDIERCIRYEKTFTRGYDNIKVYVESGYRENDIVALVTYDLLLGFTNDVAPMIIIFYLEKTKNGYIIKDNLDVGTSKYLIDCMKTEKVKSLFSDVKSRLNRTLVSNENIKLVYNSLRQCEMNMGGDINYENESKKEYGVKVLVDEAEEVKDYLVGINQDYKVRQKVNNYFERLIASLSNAQRISINEVN